MNKYNARIPVSSQNPDIQKIINNKKRIVLLNKSDLAEENKTKDWVRYFKEQNIVAIPADSNLGKGAKECLKEIEKAVAEDMEKKKQNQEKKRIEHIRIWKISIIPE